MKQYLRRRLFKTREVWGFVVLTFLTCTSLAGLGVWIDLSTAENGFEQRTVSLQRTIAHQFGNTDTILTSLVGLHHASDSLKSYEFASQSRELLAAYPFVKAIARASILRAQDRRSFEARMRFGGFLDFTLKELADRRYVQAPERPVSLPVEVFEPFDPGLARFIGFDMLSEPRLAKSVAVAVASGEVVTSAPIEIPNIGDSIFIMKAFYLGHTLPETEEARRAQVGGIITLVLEPNQFFETLVEDYADLSFDFFAHDDAAGGKERLLFAYAPEPRADRLPFLSPFTSLIPVDEKNTSFVLEVKAYARLVAIRLWLVVLLTIIGAFGCGFLGLAVWNQRLGQLRSQEGERILRENEERFRDYAEIASDWFWSADKNLRFDYSSKYPNPDEARQFPAVLGGSMDRVDGFELDDRMATRYLADLMSRRPFRDVRYSYTDESGRVQWWSVSGKPVFDSNSEFVGYRGTGRNITAETEAHEALRRSKEEAELANRAKSEFIANISHELRTPLNAIIGFSEMIYAEAFGPLGSDRYRGYANDIRSSGQHLLSLINDILDLSKVESGMDELYDEEISVADIVQALVALTKHHADKGQVKVLMDIQKDLPVLVADERKMKQILVNLLSNAIKFTRPGGCVTLRVRCSQSGGLVFQIQDTGIGMAPDEIQNALLKFRQIDSDLNRKYDGTGLGLPLAKALVELHGGELRIESQINRGTTVTVRLPESRSVPLSSPRAGDAPPDDISTLAHTGAPRFAANS